MKNFSHTNPKIQSILLMLLSSLSFAAMGALIKLSGPIPTFEKVFFRNIISLFIAILLLAKKRQHPWGKKEHRLFLLGRGLSGTIGVIFYFYAIDHLILADSGILNKMHPFFIALFAFIFLKEKFSWYQVLSLFIALAGSALVIKPGFNFDQSFPALVCLLSAVFAGLAYVFVSYLGDKENSYTIVFWFSLITTLVTLPFTLFNYVHPSLPQLLCLIGGGITAAAGQFSLTVAYRLAPAGEVSIYNYSNVIFSSILGVMLFAEIPDKHSIGGYLLIIGAGYIIFRFGSIKKNKKKTD